jgi:hypothetical protein
MRRSSERFAHHYLFGPPPEFPQASTYPRLGQLASGMPPMTPDEPILHLALLLRAIGFPSAASLTDLALPLVTTPWPVFQHGEHDGGPLLRASFLSRHVGLLLVGFRLFSPPAKVTFHLSLALLLRYRSQVVFRVGS